MKFYASSLCIALPCAQASSTNCGGYFELRCVTIAVDYLIRVTWQALRLKENGKGIWLDEKREGRGRRMKAGKEKRVTVSHPNS